MIKREDGLVKVFFGQKTFEYDLALLQKNRATMLAALKDIHPNIGDELEADVIAVAGDQAKAEKLFRGMFERESVNVSKGRFAQALASQIQDNKAEIEAPPYILNAIKHVCK